MALVALEQAFAIGSKVAMPLIMDALFTTAASGAAVATQLNRNGSAAAPTSSAPAQQPSGPTLRYRLNEAGINPDTVVAVANNPVVPPLTTDPINNRRLTWDAVDAKRASDITPEQSRDIVDREMDAIAEFFQTTPQAIARLPELSSIAYNAVTGTGPVFSRSFGQQMSRDMSFIIRAEDTLTGLMLISAPLAKSVMDAKSDYELKLGGPITLDRFVSTLGANGISGRRIMDAWQRTIGPLGGNPATSTVFRRWLLNRVLPGAAASAATFLMKQIAMPMIPSEFRSASMEDVRKELLEHELRQAADELDIGDEARSVIGSASWADRLSPLPGSVTWTSNTSADTGLSVDPYPLPIPAPIMGDIITYPGDAVFSRKLKGDLLSERLDDNRAFKRASVLDIPELELPTRTGLPPDLVVFEQSGPNKSGIHATHGNRYTMRFPAIHETARTTDHMGSQTYDTSMASTVPSFVSPATSSAGNLYGRENRAYRNALDSAPNVTGIGFDTQETERRLVEAIAVTDDSTPKEPAATITTPPINPFFNDQRSYQSRQTDTSFVPIGDMSNPVFANVGAQQPVSAAPQPRLSFPLQ